MLPPFVEPGHCDPEYKRHEAWLKDWLDHRPGQHVVLPHVSPEQTVFAEHNALTDAFNRRILSMHKYAAYAPYVGRPFMYMWRVLVDDDGRAVASDKVDLHYTVEELEWQLREVDPTFDRQMQRAEWRAQFT